MRPVFPTLVLVGVASLGATAIVQAQSARFGIGVRVDALYGQTSHDGFDGNTRLIGSLANVVFNLPVSAPMVKPYLLAGGGVYNVKITGFGADTSETKFTFDAGAGASFGAGPVHFFVEGRYISVRESGGSTSFLPVTAGVTFGLK